MKKQLILLFLLAVVTAQARNNPKAADNAVVVYGNARFTVLTDRLIRMEWAEDSIFEDRASLAIVNRNLPVPAYKASVKNGMLTINTGKLRLSYKGGRFDADNLQVRFDRGTWHPGMPAKANLKGTTRTLDGCTGFNKLSKLETELEDGILSRDGWALVDESRRHVFQETDSAAWKDGWVAQRPEGDRLDWYLFAYGHDYTAALGDFVKIAGRIPLPPKYTLDYWWSRYWIYTDEEILSLASEMRERDIPIDVMIVDMDWHYTYKDMNKRLGPDDFGQRRGWTGYTWNSELFPDPEGFLGELHKMGYKTALNLHPASGIRPYEECYSSFVADYLSRTADYDGPKDYVFPEEGWQYAGNDKPVGKAGYRASVPYRMDQMEWADAYFNSVIRPLEKQGVDFWWLDWQQWIQSKYVKDLSNTFWINHTFFTDKAGNGTERPFIYHRWGGLGSHRYQLGFSGDTYDEWDVLRFLPYFTATASNVGYGYWGHDIGGHHQLKEHKRLTEPDMYTRWMQFGVFTPIFKTHSTQNANLERKIWAYPTHYDYLLEAIRLRYTLSPYIYTFAREAYDTGVCLCRPLYYSYPEKDEAYRYNEEYLFGDRILATAVAEPEGKDGKSARSMWFPVGTDWYDMAQHTMHKGGSKKILRYSIDQNPWFVKAGSVLPLAGKHIRNLQEPSDTLGILVVPGSGKSSFRLYEDDGVSKNYENEYAYTLIEKNLKGGKLSLTIHPREGSYPGMGMTRNLYLQLEGWEKLPEKVILNGKAAGSCIKEGDAVIVSLPAVAATEMIRIEIQ